MQYRIKKINDNLYRACYSLEGQGETTVPFQTEMEAIAFCKGLKYIMQDLESLRSRQDFAKQRQNIKE